MSELFLRVLFSAAAIPLVLWAVYYGGQGLRLLVTAMLVGGGLELYLMSRKTPAPAVLPAILAGTAAFCMRGSSFFDAEKFLFPGLFCAMAVLTAAEVFRAAPERALARAGATLLAIFYVGFLGSYLLMIPGHPAHPGMRHFGLITLLFAVWAGDTAAFFMGKFFGKKVVLPSVSPKKTYMGLLGSALGSLAGMLVGRTLFQPAFPSVGAAAFIGLLLGPLGQLGDFFESLLKRACGVKDSSRIFPGHGGILDRIDSLIFCAPVYYYLLYLVPQAG